jgi:hypothetical protein
LSSAALSAGAAARMSASVPATCGAAIDVPLSNHQPNSGARQSDKI